jgi:O-antigen/teichoic acid export membrane protein
VIRIAIIVLSGNATASLFLFARNLIVARVISVEDYGIAATFAVTMAVVEMMSQLGLQQQIVQARDGDDPNFQSALQGFQVLRGISSGVLLFALAQPLANFLNVPQVAWAYQVMSVLPILNAFAHFDVHRLTRTMLFWPLILTGTVPGLLSLTAVWPLSLLYGDFRVMLYSIVLQGAATVVISHLTARRRYCLAFNAAIVTSSLRFGWPLLVNGILLFVVFNGDKMLVGRVLGMEMLAVFALGLTLTLTPTLVIAKSAQNLFLPQLSAIDRGKPEAETHFQHLALVAIQLSLLSGAFLVLAVFFFGTFFVESVLGAKYSEIILILTPMAVMQAIRLAKAGCSVIALASGHTANAMFGNLPRLITLPLTMYLLLQGFGLLTVVAVAICSELMGFVLSLFMVERRSGINLRPLRPAFFSLASFLTLSLFSEAKIFWVIQSLMFVLLGFLVWSAQDLRYFLAKQWQILKEDR